MIQIEISHIIMGSIIFLLIIVVVFLLGQRRGKKKDFAGQTPDVPIQRKAKSIKPSVKKDRKNPKYIEQSIKMLAEYSQQFAEFAAVQLSTPIMVPYTELVEYIESLDENCGVDDYEKIINWKKPNEIKSQLEGAINFYANLLIESYNDTLMNIKNLIPNSEPLISKYILGTDKAAQERSRITLLLRQDLNPFYVELNELAQMQSRLESQCPRAKELLSEKDWATTLKSFGIGGALGYAAGLINPIFAIPLIGKIFRDIKKDKAKEQFLENYFKQYAEYLEQWDKIIKTYLLIWKEQHKNYSEKVNEAFVLSINKVLELLDQSGNSLKKYPKFLKKRLHEVDQKMEEEAGCDKGQLHEYYEELKKACEEKEQVTKKDVPTTEIISKNYNLKREVESSFENIAEGIKADPEKAKSVNAVYQFNITGAQGGTWTVDLTANPPTVYEGESGKAQCTIRISDKDWLGLLSGKLNGQQLFMSGKLKISGDMSLAMKLQKVTG